MDFNTTQMFQFGANREEYIKTLVTEVYSALLEKGYNPISQMVGYILSGDPTYITGHKNARALIMKVERDEILEVLVKYFVENNA
ncbi:MAG: IreB family regulatory phosphoprotein [Clostridia bacterium]|nr:IreB family regulatory phosphoprotein [Clostridia bacterium]